MRSNRHGTRLSETRFLFGGARGDPLQRDLNRLRRPRREFVVITDVTQPRLFLPLMGLELREPKLWRASRPADLSNECAIPLHCPRRSRSGMTVQPAPTGWTYVGGAWLGALYVPN